MKIRKLGIIALFTCFYSCWPEARFVSADTTPVKEGKHTAYYAGTGALACSAVNVGANLLGLDSKWAAIGTMLVGNAAMIALTQRGNGRGNVDVMSRTVGCTLGTAGSTAGVYIYKHHENTNNALEKEELFKETKEIKAENINLKEAMESHFGVIDTRLGAIEKKQEQPAPAPVVKQTLTKKKKKSKL